MRKPYHYMVPAAPGRSLTMGANFIMDAEAVASGLAFIQGELEKLDPTLREPLTSTTYPRDIEIESGGGWVEATSAFNVSYAVTGGQDDAVGGVQNSIRRIQADISKDLYKVLPYEVTMGIKIQDQQRGAITGRSIEQIYDDGIRLDFDKYMDINTYIGQKAYGTLGLLNQFDIPAVAVATGSSGGTTWATKTAEEILNDVDEAIVAGWAAAEYDSAAIPNHILIDPANFAYINRKILSVAGTIGGTSLMNYLMENNIAKAKGVKLYICDCRFCEGTGVGGSNRMVAYVNAKRFVGMDVPAPLTRVMTQPNITTASYESLYMANVGQVKIHYTQPFIYRDGI